MKGGSDLQQIQDLRNLNRTSPKKRPVRARQSPSEAVDAMWDYLDMVGGFQRNVRRSGVFDDGVKVRNRG